MGRRRIVQISLRWGVVALLFVLLALPIRAAYGTGAIAQGFPTDDNAVVGALMSLHDSGKKKVVLATQDNTDRLIGAVGTNTLLELSSGEKEAQVVTSGVTEVLVSDVNGDIKNGDPITGGPIEGVGMKATQSVQIVGIAQGDLSDAKTTTRTLTDVDGKPQTIHVGAIPVQVNVTFYASPDDQTAVLPAFLQDLANTLAGKQVSPVRVIVSAVMLLLAFIGIAVLLYASVKSSIISIGRNPLSEGAVRKGLLEVGAMVLGVLLLTVITIYLILTT